MERITGVEPVLTRWQRVVLPLDDTRKYGAPSRSRTCTSGFVDQSPISLGRGELSACFHYTNRPKAIRIRTGLPSIGAGDQGRTGVLSLED